MSESPIVDGAQSTTGSSVLRGGAWNVASRVVPQLYLVVLSIAAARFLGPEQFGRQSFIAFASLSVAMLFTAGFHVALTRYVGDAFGRSGAGEVVGLVRLGWRIESVGAVLGAALLVGVALAGAEPRWAWLLAAASAAFGILVKVPLSLLAGAQRWRGMSLLGLATGLVVTVATVGALALGGGITGMFAVEAAGAAALLAGLSLLARRFTASLRAGPSLDRALRRDVLRYAAVTSVGVILTFVVWRRSELFVLERYSTETQIALYSIAFAAVSTLVVAFQGLTGAALPAVATLHGAGEHDRIRSGYSRAVRLLLVVALPLTAGALALGPALVSLAYGEQFEGAGTPLLILLSLLPVIPLANLSNAVLGAMGKLRAPLAAGIVAAGVNIGLDFLLIPPHGAIGAALANSAAQMTAGVPVLVYAWRTVGDVRWEPAAIVRAALAAAGGGLAAWAGVSLVGGAAGFVVGLLAGTIAFALLAAALRILPAEDARWLDETTGWLLGGLLGRLFRVWARPSAEARAL